MKIQIYLKKMTNIAPKKTKMVARLRRIVIFATYIYKI